MKFNSILLAASFGASQVLSATLQGTDAPTVYPNRYIVVLKKTVSIQDAQTHYEDIEGSQKRRSVGKRNTLQGPTTPIMTFAAAGGGGIYVIEADTATLNQILAAPEVDFVSTDQQHSIPAPVNVTEPARRLGKRVTIQNSYWHLHRISYPDLAGTPPYKYRYTDAWGGRNSAVYVVDTGTNIGHEEFENRGVCGTSFGVGGPGCGGDVQGHGTAVGSLAVGKQLGVAKRARVVPVRVLNAAGNGWTSDIIQGINWAAVHGTNTYGAGRSVINLSLGGGIDPALDSAVDWAYNGNVIPVVAAGNSNANAANTSPARANGALAVGALDISNARSWFSNYGHIVKIWAPGNDLRTASWSCNNCYNNGGAGTSFASPIVAGLAAYFQSSYSTPQGPAVIRQRLFSNCLPGVTNHPSGPALWNRRANNGGV